MDRTEREKNNKKIEKCNDGIRQLELKYIHGTFYPATAKFTFFSSAYGIFLSGRPYVRPLNKPQ